MSDEKLPGILITGTSRGIGLAMAKLCAASGQWRVYACCRKPAAAKDLQAAAASAGGRVTVHRLDVTDSAQIRALAKELTGMPIDILVNNAGVYGTREQGPADVDEKAWIEVLRANTIAPIMVAREFIPHVAASRKKIISSISSKMGSIGENSSGGYYGYRSSKAALNMAMSCLALDLRDRGITCVTLSPGWVRTDMGGSEAPLSPEQSAQGLLKVLDSVKPSDTGKFISYDGEPIGW